MTGLWTTPIPPRLADAFRLGTDGKVRAVHRVRAWRTPNEDDASPPIVLQRIETAYLGPLMQRTRALLDAR